MWEHLSKWARFPTIQALAGLGASVLGIGWTLSNWGVTEALNGMTVILLVVACVSALVAALVLTAWVGQNWGAAKTLRARLPGSWPCPDSALPWRPLCTWRRPCSVAIWPARSGRVPAW